MASEILIGVCGGVAGYKTAMLVSSLVQQGHGVNVVMTESAGRFVGESTFAALTGRHVWREVFDERAAPLGPHIKLAEQGDLLCVAPATANFLAKLAHGVADDLLSTLSLAFEGPVLLAPAMNDAMWNKPAVARNVQQVREDGYEIIGPEEGWQSCRRRGVGRMSNPLEIEARINQLLGSE